MHKLSLNQKESSFEKEETEETEVTSPKKTPIQHQQEIKLRKTTLMQGQQEENEDRTVEELRTKQSLMILIISNIRLRKDRQKMTSMRFSRASSTNMGQACHNAMHLLFSCLQIPGELSEI